MRTASRATDGPGDDPADRPPAPGHPAVDLPAIDAAAERLFAGPGEMRARCRALDWAATPLGPVGGWPMAVQAVARLSLDAAFPMCVFAGPALVLVYNDGYRALLGAGKDPGALGRPAREVWAEVWAQAGAEFARVLAGGPPVRREDGRFVIARGPDGGTEETFWTYALSPVYGDDGAVVAVHNVAAETTARVRAEAAVRASEARYRALATASADVIYRMSPDWSAMRHLDGRGVLPDTPAPEDQARVTAAVQEAVRTGSPFALEHRVMRADGTPGWTASRAVPVRDAAGAVVEWVGAASDVTARRAADAALRASAARQAFLVRLGDTLRPLADPVVIQAEAARLLGEHLGANQVHYGEVVADDGVEATVVVRQGYGDGLPPMVGTFRHHAEGWGERLLAAYRAGRTGVCRDVDADPTISAGEAAVLAGAGFRAYVAVPLVKDGAWVAVLAVHSIAPRAWTADEVALVEETAERTWAAVELVRLRRRAAELNALLVRFSDAVRGLTDPAAVADAACRLVAEELGAERAYWAEVDWRAREFVVGPAYHVAGVPVIAGRFPLDAWDPLTARQRAGDPVVVHDTQADPRIPPALRDGYARIAVGADLAAPVLAEGQLRCTLAVNQRHPRQWTPEEVALVVGIAGRCWAEVERARAEGARRASEARQAFLLTLSDALRPLADPVAMQREALRMLRSHLGVPRALYAEARDQDGTMRIVAEHRAPGLVPMEGLVLRFADFTPDALAEARAGRPLWREDVLRDDHTPAQQAGYAALGTRAWAMIPLVKEGRLVAELTVHAAEARVWAPEDLGLLQEATERTWAAVERARAEAALRASEAKYSAAFDTMDEGFCLMELVRGADGAIVDLVFRETNRAFTQQTGLSDVTGRTVGELLPAFEAYWVEAYTRVARTGVAERVENYVRDVDRWYSVYFARAGGEASRHVAVLFADITERKRAEAALRASEARYRTLFETMRQGYCDLELLRGSDGRAVDQRYLDLNPAFERIFGVPVARARGRTAREVFPELEPWWHAAFDRIARAGTPERLEHEVAALGRWYEVQVYPRGGDRLTVLYDDVTARKGAEVALAASEARYRTLVEHVRDYAICLLDADGVVTEWPAGAARVTGYPAAEAVGQPVARHYPPADVAAGVPAAHLAEAAHAGHGEWEGWRVRRDGTRFWANEIATAIRDADGRLVGFTKVTRDLTERRLAAQAAEQAQRQAGRDELRRALAAAEEAERRRLARELHDQLGQELTAFRLGLDDAARLTRALAAGGADGAADPLLARLGQLQALAGRMTAGARAIALELRPPELDDVGLEGALETYVREWAARYGVAAEVAVTGLAERALPADVGTALYRIAQEALTNVAKHAHATQVSVLVDQADGHGRSSEGGPAEVRLIVEDDGRGFDVDATAARVRDERRLGLAGMRERAALVGGTVAIESSPGGGTTLYVRLPVGGPGEPPAGPSSSGTVDDA